MQAHDVSPAASYDLREGADALLRAEPGLRELVEEACAQVRQVFGPATPLALERFDDRDSSGTAPMLFVRIGAGIDPDAACERMRRFDEAYWLDNVVRGHGRLEFALEFA